MTSSKENLLNNLKDRLKSVQAGILHIQEQVKRQAFKSIHEINAQKKEDREHGKYLKQKAQIRLNELKTLEKSPFFSRCNIQYRNVDIRGNNQRIIYFGKYECLEQQIYSWVTPIASIRFDPPGSTTFRLPNGEIRTLDINEKEQYMIVDGKIIFYARETKTEPRELIHQEHFSIKKGAFILPEIIEVMEKAQDAVIRAYHKGPFVISGPAGSGKTTLALHRVAYLVQSPETSSFYPTDTIAVFVQDSGTKEYFSHLLPELGIHNINITTFHEWSMKILNLREIEYSMKTYSEFNKLSILKRIRAGDSSLHLPKYNKDAFSILKIVYQQSGSTELLLDFEKQKKARELDKIDLTLCLMILRGTLGSLEMHSYSNRAKRGGGTIIKKNKTIIKHPLIIVDEFQNYLPEQLKIFNSCLDSETRSIVYVGDMAQQVQLGTIREWREIDVSIPSDRHVKLEKVYRNTKEILSFINNLGYTVSIPTDLKNGPEVCETIFKTNFKKETINYITELLKDKIEVSIGVIGKGHDDIDYLRVHFDSLISKGKLHVSTILEAQGVEFDIVCIVGIKKGMFTHNKKEYIPEEYKCEFLKIQKDSFYIALTRAMNEMHILGESSLKDEISHLNFYEKR
jgi:DNA helicase IV